MVAILSFLSHWMKITEVGTALDGTKENPPAENQAKRK